MEITNELLAAYAEGNVSKSERDAVRQYLIDNPDELETIMIMMECVVPSNDDLFSDIRYSSAAFAPRSSLKKSHKINHDNKKRGAFKKHLNDLLDELDI